jgi:hypothetical protein
LSASRILIQGNEDTGIWLRDDGIYVVVYKYREVGLWTKKRWARASLRRALLSDGRSN